MANKFFNEDALLFKEKKNNNKELQRK